MSDLTGHRLGSYELRALIRRGGTAAVYKAFQPSLGRFVAVKVLALGGDPAFAARFQQEARSIAALQHPNIIQVYDYGEQDGQAYLVMQYVEEGVTLADVAAEPPSPRRSAELLGLVLEGLGYAHRRGIVHRDVKPSNVLMASPTWPMLADFGIAKLLAEGQGEGPADARLTSANTVVGTPAYMTPEQAFDRPVDARTDLYAAGVVLYELLCGRVPFKAESAMATLMQHAYEQPPPPRLLNPALPEALEALLLKALAKDPADRFQSAEEMGAALAELVPSLPTEALPVATPDAPPGARRAPASPWRASSQAFAGPGSREEPVAAGTAEPAAPPAGRLGRWWARLGLATAGVLLAAVAVWGFSRQVGRAPGITVGGGTAASVTVTSAPPGSRGATPATSLPGWTAPAGAVSSRPRGPASTAAVPTTAPPATTAPGSAPTVSPTSAPLPTPTPTATVTATSTPSTPSPTASSSVSSTASAVVASDATTSVWPWPVGGLLLTGVACLRRRRSGCG